jgi:hypothetical protein
VRTFSLIQRTLSDFLVRPLQACRSAFPKGPYIPMYAGGPVRTYNQLLTHFDFDIVRRQRWAAKWSIEQRSAYIESILMGFPTAPFLLQEEPDGLRIPLDGRTRLAVLCDFCLGRFALTGLRRLKRYNGCTYTDLGPVALSAFCSYPVAVYTLTAPIDAATQKLLRRGLNTKVVR